MVIADNKDSSYGIKTNKPSTLAEELHQPLRWFIFEIKLTKLG
jgi:hypothetical protein